MVHQSDMGPLIMEFAQALKIHRTTLLAQTNITMPQFERLRVE